MKTLYYLMTVVLLVMASTATAAPVSRKADVVASIYAYNHPFAATLPGELAVKMDKMAVDAFAFYRGTAHLFFSDLANKTAWPESAYNPPITQATWIQGDMHLDNMGGFRDATGKAVFAVNDFDEGYWGHYTWDIRRMAVAIQLAALQNGISQANADALVTGFVDSYITQLTAFNGNDSELTFKQTSANTTGVVSDTIKAADAKKRSDLLAKYTQVTGSSRVFQTIAGSLTPADANVKAAFNQAMPDYIASIPLSKRQGGSYYNLKDVAQRSGSGTGSLGRYRYYVLIEGDTSDTGDDVILEVKQESNSVVTLAAPDLMPASAYNNHNGFRAIRTGKAFLLDADANMGYATVGGLPYAFFEKLPYQEDFDHLLLSSNAKFSTAVKYFGKAAAHAHALADKDYDAALISYGSDNTILSAITSTAGFKAETLAFAKNYAAQVKQDYADFVDAKKAGAVLY